MKRLTATLCLTLAVLLGSAGVSWSADFQKGAAAYRSGDYATALREWTPFAEQGHARSQFNLGLLYSEGHGVSKDAKKALKWFTLAAKQGDRNAQHNLSLMYKDGRGVLKNHGTAVKFMRLAAEQGHSPTQFNLGVSYGIGEGTIQDNVYAHMWWNIAASSGNEGALKYIDIISKEMTPSQLEKAQDLARECVRKNYKGC